MKLQYPYGNHLGEQFGHLLAVSAIETDAETGDPVIYDCKCMKCGKEHIHVLDRDLLSYKIRCCEDCDKHNLTGMRFSRIIVLERIGHDKHYNSIWRCVCSCDKHTEMFLNSVQLVTGNTKSCGCYKHDILANRADDLVGRKFGRLTVIRRANNSHATPSSTTGKVMYECVCECGNTCITYSHLLKSGKTQSCGCFNKERSSETHKKWTDLELRILSHYSDMKKRCYNTKCDKYSRYGGRGIYICDEWMDPETGRSEFLKWAQSNGYKDGLEIDRYPDRNGPYAPWNCRWATRQQQNNNKDNNVVVNVDGIEHTLAEWSRISGLKYDLLKYHLKKGIDVFKSTIKQKTCLG